MPIIAAEAAPSGTPQYIRLTAVPRRRSPAASEHRAIRLGSAAPRPTPVNRRAPIRLYSSQAWAVAMEKMPNSATEAINTRLRPMRSAIQPPTSAPGSRPRMPALNTQPICSLSSSKAAAMPRAAIPGAWKSMPSSTATAKHRAMVTQVRRLS
ncbi:hypothetical protein D3C78_1097880 [compost metagenome]